MTQKQIVEVLEVEAPTAAPVEEKQKVVIRKLSTPDFWALLKIVKKGGQEALSRLNGAADEKQSVMIILDVGMEFAETELKTFLAGIAEMTIEEYDQGDFDLTLEILEQWQEKEDLASFFARAASFIKKFSFKK